MFFIELFSKVYVDHVEVSAGKRLGDAHRSLLVDHVLVDLELGRVVAQDAGNLEIGKPVVVAPFPGEGEDPVRFGISAQEFDGG